MESFFGRLKVEMYYCEKFRTADEFVHRLEEYMKIFYFLKSHIMMT